jgi:hypothetical protein
LGSEKKPWKEAQGGFGIYSVTTPGSSSEFSATTSVLGREGRSREKMCQTPQSWNKKVKAFYFGTFLFYLVASLIFLSL